MLESLAEVVLRLFAEVVFHGLCWFVGKVTVAALTLGEGSCSDDAAVLLGGTVVFFGVFVAIVLASR